MHELKTNFVNKFEFLNSKLSKKTNEEEKEHILFGSVSFIFTVVGIANKYFTLKYS